MNRKQRRLEGKPDHPGTRAPPPGVRQWFTDGHQLHQAGRFSEAEQRYRQVLAVSPRHADSLHLLGVVAYQTGRYDLAVNMIGRAISINDGSGLYHYNLGNARKAQGQLEAAAASYRRSLELWPEHPDTYVNLGGVLKDQGALDEAIACFRRILSPRPDLAEAHNGLGAALQIQGHLDEAVACFRRALYLKPDLAETHVNLGSALQKQERLDDAIASFRTALNIRPDFLEAHFNLGNALKEQRRLDEAIVSYRQVIALRPDHCDGHFNLGIALLSRGDLTAGWEEYEWRWKTSQMVNARRHVWRPAWRGEPAAGQTLLIHAEQGFGDTMQFCRYAPLAAATGLRVIMEVQKPLVRLLRDLPGVALVVGRGDELPDFDVQCPILSMPWALRDTVSTVPGGAAYLHADPEQAAVWRDRLAALDDRGPRVGLVWSGNPFFDRSPALAEQARRRSIDPGWLAPLLEVPGLQFFSLQKDAPVAPDEFGLIDHMGEMTDFADTAALIANLDLVVAVDTAVAHLAGALGKPVWLLDRYDSCWRWIEGRRDSPWYPSLRVYHQPQPGAWEPVLAEVVRDLHGLAGMRA